jgi:hypothetical protein
MDSCSIQKGPPSFMNQAATRRPTGRSVYNVRGIHSLFTAIYTILGAFFLGAPIIFINYEVIFQSGLMGFFIVVGALMISIVMIGKELCRQLGEFAVLRRHTITIAAAALFSILFSFWWLWNIINILSMCDDFAAPNTTGSGGASVQLLVYYTAPYEGIMRQQVLTRKYGYDEKHGLLEAQQVSNATNRRLRQTQSYRYTAQRARLHAQRREILRALSQENEQESHFSLLENEIIMLFEEEKREVDERTSYSVKSVTPIHVTTAEEDAQFQELRARKICRNEQGFAIFLAILIIITMILNLITIGVYTWLRTVICL